MTDVTFTITIHFGNGVTIEQSVPLSKAAKLAMKENVLVADDTEYVEIRSINNSIIIPLNMMFVVQKSPKFQHLDRVSRFMLYKRDGGRCSYCEKEISQKEATIDHVIPKSQGGSTSWENVVLCCKKCNCIKDNRTPEEAGMKLKVVPYNPKRKKKQ